MTFTVTVRGLNQVLKGLARYNEEMQEALDAGTRNAATAIRNSVRAELRTPGTGREYPSRRGRAIRGIERDLVSVKESLASGRSRSKVLPAGSPLGSNERKSLERGIVSAERRLARAIKKQGKRPGKLHRASEVGRAPAPDVGLLPQAVKAGKREGAYRVGVGGEWEGWEALHEGRGRLTGRRPFIELGIARIKDRLAGIWTRAIESRKGPA
jgi:hypothetical protein